MKSFQAHHAVVAILFAAATTGALLVACDSDSAAVKEQPNPKQDGSVVTPTQDGSVIQPMQDGGDGGPTDCVQNPQTHEEIINGCTSATRVPKNPTLPLLLPDGALPVIM